MTWEGGRGERLSPPGLAFTCRGAAESIWCAPNKCKWLCAQLHLQSSALSWASTSVVIITATSNTKGPPFCEKHDDADVFLTVLHACRVSELPMNERRPSLDCSTFHRRCCQKNKVFFSAVGEFATFSLGPHPVSQFALFIINARFFRSGTSSARRTIKLSRWERIQC